MSDSVRFVPNTEAALAFIVNRYGTLAEVGAELLRDEIKSRVPESDIPSEPGQPPHSPGPYRDSWHASGAKRRGDAVVAWTYSMAKRGDGSSLARALEFGDHQANLSPRPHVRGATDVARAALDATVRSAGR